MLPVSVELFRSTVFPPLPYLSNSSLFPSPFQISHREPSHSSSLVHRSLANIMVPDWSSSKRGSNWRPFDPVLGLLGQGENSTDSSVLNAPLLTHYTKTFFLLWREADSELPSPNITMWPSNQSQNGWPLSPHRTFPLLLVLQFVKLLLSNVYLNVTKEQACQTPTDGQKDMFSFRWRCTLCWDSSDSTTLKRNSGLKAKRKRPALTHKHPLSKAVMDRQRAHAEAHEC